MRSEKENSRGAARASEYAVFERVEEGQYVEVHSGFKSQREAEGWIKTQAADTDSSIGTDLLVVRIARRIKLNVQSVQKVSFE